MDYVVRVSGTQKLQPKIININGSDDSFYRYKMRQLLVQVTGKGKMIKTNLLNVDDVSHDLKVPPAFMTAYLGYEIGAPSKFDAKKPDRERGSISGDYDGKVLSSKLKKMIDDLILCPNCRLPELTMVVDPKKEKIQVECRGCGATSDLTLTEKFRKFVLNNNDKLKEVKQQMEKAKEPKAAAKAKAAGESAQTEEGDSPNDVNGDNTNTRTKTSRSSRSSSKKEELLDENDFNSEDTDEEWVVAPGVQLDNQLSDRVKQLIGVDSQADAASQITKFSESHTKTETMEEIKRLQKEHKWKNSKSVELLFPVLFAPQTDLLANLVESLPLLKPFLTDSEGQQKFLSLTEDFCQEEDSVNKACVLFKKLYDEEILDEENILKWHSAKDSKSKFASLLREKSLPFVNWLKTAEEESDEDE